MSILKVKNPTTGEWEEIVTIVGPTGPAGPQGPQGLDGKDGITPHIGDNGNWFIGETDTEMPSQGETVLPEAVLYTPQRLTEEQKAQAIQNVGAVPAPMIATVGQTIVVKAVDENGVPTECEAADLPSGDIFYVHITKTGENTDTSNKTFAEITEAKKNNKIVQCKYAQYILPLCWLDDVYAIFGGATSNVTIGIFVDSNNGVQVQTSTLAIEGEVPTKEEFNTLKNSVSAIDDTIGTGTPLVETAAVGQTVVVKAVDENGKPTEWEVADMASGGGRCHPFVDDWGDPVAEIVTSEEVQQIRIHFPTDDYRECLVQFIPAVSSTATDRFMRGSAWIGSAFGGGEDTEFNTAHTNGQIFPSLWYAGVSPAGIKQSSALDYVRLTYSLVANAYNTTSFSYDNPYLRDIGFRVPSGHYFGIGTKVTVWGRK